MHHLWLVVMSFIYLRPFSPLFLLKKTSVWVNEEYRPALKHEKTKRYFCSGPIIALSGHNSNTSTWSYKESGNDTCQPFTPSIKVSVTPLLMWLLSQDLDSSSISSNSFEWALSFNWFGFHQNKGYKRWSKVEAILYDPHLQVTGNHFYHILCVISHSLSSAILKDRGINVHLLMGEVSKNWWAEYKTTATEKMQPVSWHLRWVHQREITCPLKALAHKSDTSQW